MYYMAMGEGLKGTGYGHSWQGDFEEHQEFMMKGKAPQPMTKSTRGATKVVRW
jgi:hypothetical protein